MVWSELLQILHQAYTTFGKWSVLDVSIELVSMAGGKKTFNTSNYWLDTNSSKGVWKLPNGYKPKSWDFPLVSQLHPCITNRREVFTTRLHRDRNTYNAAHNVKHTRHRLYNVKNVATFAFHRNRRLYRSRIGEKQNMRGQKWVSNDHKPSRSCRRVDKHKTQRPGTDLREDRKLDPFGLCACAQSHVLQVREPVRIEHAQSWA